mgnify:CR=1 FL=1
MRSRDVERILKTLANRRRVEIVKYLKENGRAFVGEIAGEINLSFKATSKHLGILSAVEVLEKDQDGLRVLYRLNGEMPSFAKLVINSF